MVVSASAELTLWLEAVASGLVELLSNLGLEVECPSTEALPIPDCPGSHVSLETKTESHLVGLVAPEENLWRLATTFMGTDPEAPLDRLALIDAIGELTNILAGNLRDVLLAGLPEVHVGLPTFAGGALYPSGPIARGALHLRVLGVDFYVLAQRYALPPSRVEFLRMTDELRDREARLQAMLNAAVDGVITLDEFGRVESCNPSAERLFGRSDLVGAEIGQLVAGWEARLGPAAEPLDPSRDLIAHRAAAAFPIEVASSEFTIDDRKMQTLFVRDLTRRRKAEAQLRQAQKLEAIGQLAAGVAHEINTPLQFIGDNTRFTGQAVEDLLRAARLAKEALGGQEAQREALRAALDAFDLEFLAEETPRAIRETLDGLERAGDIVRAMKAFAHPDEGRRVLVDLNAVVKTSVTVCRNEWKDFADVELDLAPRLPELEANRGQLHQVVLNLVVNAAHAIHDSPRRPGQIRVQTRVVDDGIELQVQDDGCGIPEAAQGRVFDPFFTTKPVGRGTGQGLNIVWSSVVETHGGRVWFETAAGVGTTFFVTLPSGAR